MSSKIKKSNKSKCRKKRNAKSIEIDPIEVDKLAPDHQHWENLANAIVISALDEYTTALIKYVTKDYCYNASSERYFSESKCKRIVKDVQMFVNSEYYGILTNLDGSYLLDVINKRICVNYGVTKNELPL